MSDLASTTLEIRNLSVSYGTERGPARALRDVSMSIPAGRIVGIVGESGCGKSTLIASIIRLLAPNATIDSGSILFGDTDLVTLDAESMRALRGDRISMVSQDPMTSLNPVLTIGRQMMDVQHRLTGSKQTKLARAAAMLDRVGIPDAVSQLGRYPHHLSGGMRQRVAIAMALMTEPALLIADEPTTALDATLEVQIIHRLQQLQRDFGCSILFISHHLGVIAELCDDVVVMYAGEVVETGTMRAVFADPRHPYTRKLLECDPARIRQRTRTLPVIPGGLPDLVALPEGCVFRPRCDRAIEVCEATRPRLVGHGSRAAACHLAEEAQ